MSWYHNNKERALQWQREYRKRKHDNVLKNRRRYDKENHQHQLELKYQWRKNNLEKYKQQKRKDNHRYRLSKKHDPQFQEKERIRHARYHKENPDKTLKNGINHLKKLGLTLNMTHFKVGMLLKAWSQTIRKNYPFCWCGKKADVTHHLFYKQFYPKLMFNINNGIPLCTKHHNEVHGIKLVNRGRD